jgi:hypothetical protein
MLVKNITINGAQVPLVLGMHLAQMMQTEAVKPGFTGTKMQAYLIYLGHENYCLVNGVDNKLTLAQCFAHVEEVGYIREDAAVKEMDDLIISYMGSKPVLEMMEIASEIQKKKVVGTK